MILEQSRAQQNPNNDDAEVLDINMPNNYDQNLKQERIVLNGAYHKFIRIYSSVIELETSNLPDKIRVPA